jgi:hypothetical protein
VEGATAACLAPIIMGVGSLLLGSRLRVKAERLARAGDFFSARHGFGQGQSLGGRHPNARYHASQHVNASKRGFASPKVPVS